MSRDEQSDHLNQSLDDEEGATLQQLQGHSITYRIAMGPQAGRKVLTACAARRKQFEAWEEDDYGTGQLGKVGGFSLHWGGLPSGVAVNTRERKKLERICRYISRPALSEARLELTDQRTVRYALKTAYLRGPIVMGLRMWCSSRWILWPNWQRWCPSLKRISHDFMEYWHRTVVTEKA